MVRIQEDSSLSPNQDLNDLINSKKAKSHRVTFDLTKNGVKEVISQGKELSDEEISGSHG
jgi:hypothetical protein